METLSESIRHLIPEGRPSIIGRSRRRTCSGLLQHLLERLRYLEHTGAVMLCNLYLSYFPTSTSAEPDSYYILRILQHEYGRDVVEALSSAPQAPISKADELKNARRDIKLLRIAAARQASVEYDHDWPEVTSTSVVLHCLNQYYERSMWTEPAVCALDVLRLRDLFIITKCIVQNLSPRFNYAYPALNGLMLDHRGVVCDEKGEAALLLCRDCSMSLSKERIPRFALANGLYRGELPDIFADLTWIEEKICALYCLPWEHMHS
ncbi:hypothetical protein EDC04DRAFT_462744 [Pisolithus marmoratus]|nr:hypothetical protein EDC04DRAFT_462744 [Pisolithus marmoratus]